MTKSWIASAVLLVLVLALLGCGPERELEPCNIATESCQEDIYYALVRMRGDGFDPFAGVPPINTVPLETYRMQLQAAAEARQRAAMQEPCMLPDPDEPVPVVPWDFALQVLGLVEPSKPSCQASVENQVSNVAAYYSPATRSVTVIDRGFERDDFFDTGLLLHELTHALQDRELSGDFIDDTTDGTLAARALTEGEATFYQHLSHFEMDGAAPERFDWHHGYTNNLLGGRVFLTGVNNKGEPNEKSPFYGVRWFIYPLGARFLSDAWERGGNAGMRHAYATQPRHIGQFMTPYDEESEGVRAVLDPALSCPVEPPGEGWERPGFDRFGALLVYALFTGAKVSDEVAWPIASGWDDDLIYVFFEPEDEIVLVSWRIRLADDEAAKTVAEQMVVDERVRVSVEGRDLVLIAGNDEEVTADWQGTLVCR
jgi:hypothetical protein